MLKSENIFLSSNHYNFLPWKLFFTCEGYYSCLLSFYFTFCFIYILYFETFLQFCVLCINSACLTLHWLRADRCLYHFIYERAFTFKTFTKKRIWIKYYNIILHKYDISAFSFIFCLFDYLHYFSNLRLCSAKIRKYKKRKTISMSVVCLSVACQIIEIKMYWYMKF